MTDEIKPAPAETQSRRTWCSKVFAYLRWKRNQVDPGVVELPDCDFLNVAPRRTLRILRPQLKSERFYEAQSPANRPESINDNFYSRWARRPHPSGNCRCSFRQSVNSNRLSSHEEQIISQEIQRIRSSLCEAEKCGKDIEEVEKSLSVNLTHLQATVSDKEAVDQRNLKSDESQPNEKTKIEPLEEHVKRKIVRDLDRYISDLLDEILNDTIRAIARADNPFERERKEADALADQPAAFDISFAFHSKDEDNKATGAQSSEPDANAEEKGYVNQGFVGSASNPDAVEFQLRGRLIGDVILENVDCIDSGINSVETIELQPEQDQNLEQSLIDIIDAKLGGASIGKSLEDLGMEIDATDEAKTPKMKEAVEESAMGEIIPEAQHQSASRAEATVATVSTEVKKSTSPRKEVTIREAAPVDPPAERTSKSLDEVIEEPSFNSLRLEFKRRSNASNTSKESEEKQASNVTARVNKTVTTIRRRIATRLANSRRKPNNNTVDEKSSKSSAGSGGSAKTRASLELEDYRRRFPVPEAARQRHGRARPEDEIRAIADGEVTLRNRHRKPMLIFLHGFGSSAESFEPQLRYFADLGYPCIAPDLLGHGMSSAPNRRGDYHFDKLFKDLETILLHYAFKPGQKCVLVAHNYGCSFASALACKYMSNVHQLVLISGGGPTPLAPPLSEGPVHCFLRATLTPFLLCGMHRAVLYSARGRQHPYCGSELLEEQWPSHMRHVLRGMSWPEGDYVFHRRMCTPTLLVHGLRDNKVSLVQECQMERTMVKAFLEAIPTAGHMPMTDCPEQLNHMIHCFIDLWKNKKW